MINYKLISDAIGYYQSIGYQYIEVPWIVYRKATLATAPEWVRPFETFMGDLVGSGEQGFIQMMMNGVLEPGKYVCATPCFRDEPYLDDIHMNCFFKVELINTENVNERAWMDMMEDARVFFSHSGLMAYKSKITDDQYDLNDLRTDIELGSYGIRRHKDLAWVFGTGCAEPRLSLVLAKNDKRQY